MSVGSMHQCRLVLGAVEHTAASLVVRCGKPYRPARNDGAHPGAVAAGTQALPADIPYTIASLVFRIVRISIYVSAYLSLKHCRLGAIDRLTKSTKQIPERHGSAAR